MKTTETQSKYLKTLCVLCASVVLSLTTSCTSNAETTKATFKLSNGTSTPTLKLEVADDNGERSLGLMYRKEMGEKEGMLFIFPKEEKRAFWMKNTYLSLDIIYLDADKKVVKIVEKATPHSESRLHSEKPAKYVVELLAGSARRLGIDEGAELVTR